MDSKLDLQDEVQCKDWNSDIPNHLELDEFLGGPTTCSRKKILESDMQYYPAMSS